MNRRSAVVVLPENRTQFRICVITYPHYLERNFTIHIINLKLSIFHKSLLGDIRNIKKKRFKTMGKVRSYFVAIVCVAYSQCTDLSV